MSERRLREIVRPNYCEDNSSPSPPKRNKWQNAGTVNHPSSSAKRDSSPKGKGLENAATTKIERKLPARCSITNENSSVAALVSTNCTLINRFAEQSKDLLKKADSILALQHSLHEEKAKNMKLNAAIIVKDKQIEDLQHQLKAMRDSQYCRDLICFDIEEISTSTTPGECVAAPTRSNGTSHESTNDEAPKADSNQPPISSTSNGTAQVNTSARSTKDSHIESDVSSTENSFKWTPLQ